MRKSVAKCPKRNLWQNAIDLIFTILCGFLPQKKLSDSKDTFSRKSLKTAKIGIYGKMPNLNITNATAVQPRESPTKCWFESLRNSVLQASEEAQYQLT
ncbi:hypothetical protein AD936_07665 [Gluconobacter japonicus]|nr:hypothetical protein AD936_07665 [Gluconobacter japonicus]